jgi:threonine/homoserine/homoserine lactone efflux protein
MELVDPRFAAFLAVAALFIVTPGPDTALTIRNALLGGSRAASMTALGVGLGSLAWAILSALGIAILLERSQTLFTILKLAGGAYLVYLGLRSLLARMPVSRADPSFLAGTGAAWLLSRLPALVAFRQGLLNNLLNPKAGAFFVAVFPQFLAPHDPVGRLALMTSVYEAMVVAWLCLYGYVVSRAGRSRLGMRVRAALSRITGVVLIGLGVRLAFERR